MAKQSKKKKRPTDLNLLAASIVEDATNDKPSIEERTEKSTKNPAAVALGRLGGLKGGKARAIKLTKKQRIEIARKAAKARWAK
ncbi:hypothetical protein KA005_05560 [bacterium]|nr:hypothetical protein [bacterium]